MMAVLTPADIAEMQKTLRNDPVARTERRDSKADIHQLIAAVQALEDRWEAGRVATKLAMDTASGITLTNTFAKKLGKAWLLWKVKGE